MPTDDMNPIDVLVDAQTEVAQRIDHFISNFNKSPKERLTMGYLSARASGIKALWDEYTQNHKVIVSELDPKTRLMHPYFKDEVFSKYEDRYYDVSGRIAQKQLTAAAANTASTSSSTNNNTPILDAPHQVAHHIQVPRLNVPSFNGAYEDWQSFHDLFIAAVHSNPTLRPSQKLQYLKSLLRRKLWPNTHRSLMQIMTSFGKISPIALENASSIRILIDNTKECINALTIQNIDITSWDAILVYIISQYIPKPTIDLWEQSLASNDIPSYNALLAFLENRFRILECSTATSTQTRSRSKQQSFHASSSSKCRVCESASHPLRKCHKFIEMNPTSRLNYIKNAKLCKNCFAYSHSTQDCQSNGRCNVCKQRHHSMLHLSINPTFTVTNSPPVVAFPSAQTNSNTAPSTTLMSRPTCPSADDSILATALVVITSFNGTTHKFRALLDNASQESFVSKRLIQFLGLKLRSTSMVISGVGQSQAPKPIGQVNFTFASQFDTSICMNIDAVVLPNITYNLPSKSLCVPANLIANLELADPSYGTPGSIDILLSASVFAELTLPSIRKEASTIALKTKLGWVLYGDAIATPSQHNRACFHVASVDVISSALLRFWQLEEVARDEIQSPEDVECETIYAQTHSRDINGRYCVTLPFKSRQVPTLGSSRDRAVSRFLQIERKLLSDDRLRADYAKCIHEYLHLGHMAPISTTEEQHRVSLLNDNSSYTSYYLPHHAVIKADSSTTKLRVVFDASSKTTNGVSLNETLLTGPVIQDSLFNLLLRWRTHRFALKADIEKMYRQVLVHESHQPYQRIIWRDNPHDVLQDFQLRTVTFGTAAAPYLAIKTIQQLARDEEINFPIGALAIRHDFYVDDLLSGAETVGEAVNKQNQITGILQSGGFQIRKWSSNDSNVTKHLDDAAKEVCGNSDSILKTLGILWSPLHDALSIKITPSTTVVSTKRQLLSEIAKLFDPLGWIAPVIITMKILLQKLWLAGLAWDDLLPNSIQMSWNDFQSQLHCIEQINIERWLQTSPDSSIEVHGFSDASEKAYAAAIYVRVKIKENVWSTHLLAAKTRVAPVKQVSLPRLELCAAVLLAKLLVTITSTFKSAPIFAWTDSEIVLAWLQGHPSRWTTFVANRVSCIHDIIDASSWHHVPTKDNPADCASRGIPPQQLVDHLLWWHGPSWLSMNKTNWPNKQKREIAPTTIECKRVSSFVTIRTNDTLSQIIDHCSSITKAERVTAYVRRWFFPKKHNTFSVEEISKARNLLIQHTQQSSFADELSDLSAQKPIHKNSKLRSLHPFIDNDHLMRVGGRMPNSDIPFEVRHPLIIPKHSRFTDLIIDAAHADTLHGGISLTLALLRNRYWIIDARTTIRHRIHKCNTCFKFTNKCLNQLMGNLPKPRVTASNPFTHTGLDYAGPISIRMRRHRGRPVTTKGYICLFVCLATKAIHLELVGDMTAETFLAAFHRFTSRRGLPSDMYSDNGTYFVRAAHDIDEDIQKVQRHSVEAAKVTTQSDIQWHFIPPAAPHFGGLWEAGIKSTKYHLKRHLGDELLTYEEMTTTLCQIEACLNSRPLCPISNDPNDFEILTPGHFLIGRALLARAQPNTINIPTDHLKQWQRIYQITQRFWKQWQSEYLTRLQQRPKWLAETNNIERGELVLLKEDNLPPTQWKLARVIATHPGADGLTRVVTVNTSTTTLKRPIVKLCKLPTQ